MPSGRRSGNSSGEIGYILVIRVGERGVPPAKFITENPAGETPALPTEFSVTQN
jgi:hypothetical protein